MVYVIVPVYNVFVENDLLNKEIIDGYCLISNEQFFETFKEKIILNDTTYIALSLLEDIALPINGMLITRPYASYMLIKEYEENENFSFDEFCKNEVQNLYSLILLLRLIRSGRCQVNKCYIFGQNFSEIRYLACSTNLENMYGYLSTKDNVYETIYTFNAGIEKDLEQINDLTSKIKACERLKIPLIYFNQYYNVKSVYERIINLAIVLESSLLADTKDELKYRLKIRTSAFLNEDYSDIMACFYDIRSAIVHNGVISKKDFNYIKKYINHEDYSDAKALFVFVNDYIELLVRKVLNKAFEIFALKPNISDYQQLCKDIDNDLIRNLIKCKENA